MSKSKLAQVIIEPDGIEVHVPSGTLISKVAAASGVAVESPCGGVGTCKKCRIIASGNVSAPDLVEIRSLTDEELSSGVRLACRAKVMGSVNITIPESSRSMVQKILSHGVMRECSMMSGVSKEYCELPKPSLEDETAEFERLAKYLLARDIVLKPNLKVARTLSSQLRQNQYSVTAVIADDELIAVEPGDTTGDCYGIAYDIGSTTIVGYLLDLTTGRELGAYAVMNPQVVYGDDLVARIGFGISQLDGAVLLQSAVIDAIDRVAGELARHAGVSTKNIYKVTFVGNTCMTHILLGIDVASLGQSPYVPTVCKDVTLPASELGLEFCPEAKVIVLPNIAGFVGSDTVGVMLSAEWDKIHATCLAVDIGTNGEMALMHKGRTYVCSAAAGPAFEGAGISCGMRGAPGAIDSVIIDEDIKITTIHGKKPVGICGSGLVDAVAQMLDKGIVDDSGRMIDPSQCAHLPQAVQNRMIIGQAGPEFVLATAKESGHGKAVTLTGADIRHLQLAKGSIHAAIQTLLAHAGTSEGELTEVMLAGAFGNYIKVESAIRIGLLPAIDIEKVKSIGNGAGAGARLALLCENEMEIARQLAESAEHIELAVSPQYQMELMERMMFPVI